MKTLLVTGAGGFVGRHLCAALSAAGIEFIALTSASGDIATAALPLDGCDHVIHLAGKSFVPDSWVSPAGFYRVNVQGTINVLDQCRLAKLPLTLVSSYVYGQPRELPISESHPLSPLNPYAHSKILAEEAARSFEAFFQSVVTIVRPFNLYGPGQDPRFLIPMLISQALDSSRDAFEVADDRPRRDYLYIRDFVDLLIRTAATPVMGALNAGSGVSHSVADITAILNTHLDPARRVTSRREQRPVEVVDTVADIARAQASLGWSPTTSFSEGIALTLEAARGSR
jgi:nucleoside-diphosphate-sugar epimerase